MYGSMVVCMCIHIPHVYAQVVVHETDYVFECVCACVSTHVHACVWCSHAHACVCINVCALMW